MKTLTNKQELFKAFAEGKEVQFCTDNVGWQDYNPVFSFLGVQFRIKPNKVKKWKWVVKNKTGHLAITSSEYTDQVEYNNKNVNTYGYVFLQPILETEIEVEEDS